ncbi:hypothetical protein [Streptomyces qinzhouensis]|uniref:hypothetical protein n=1 Tax=Streptomyces qinzhouensis TaxID=2599401 RepID=UPI001646B4B3|nr:hypothetical protein [Streptomyces qinzhouensis]
MTNSPPEPDHGYTLTLAGKAVRRPVDGAVWIPLRLRRHGHVVEETGAAVPPDQALALAHQILELAGGTA